MRQVRSAIKELIWIGEYIMRGNWYQITRRLKNILRVMTEDVEYIVRTLDEVKEQEELMTKLVFEIRSQKLDIGMVPLNCYGIGSFLQIAEHYNLKFGIGTCFGDCRVDLSCDDWECPLDQSILSTDYGTWTKVDSHKVTSIYGYGKTLPEAIMRCLLNARIAKVI